MGRVTTPPTSPTARGARSSCGPRTASTSRPLAAIGSRSRSGSRSERSGRSEYALRVATSFQVTFDCADPDRLARFWATVLGYRLPDPPDGFATWEDFLRERGVPEDQWNAASALEDPAGVGP